MEESSFHLIFSKQFPWTLLNFLQHCHNKITPSKMFFTIVLILSFSSILCLLHLHQGSSCMNNQRNVMAHKKSNNYLDYIVMQIRVWLYNFFLGLEMAIGTCIGVSPFSFRRRKFSALIEEKKMLEESNKIDTQVFKPNIDEEITYHTTSNSGKKFNTFMEKKLCGLPKEFTVMTEIRNKTLIMRDLLDLSPCNGSSSLHELLILTLKDLCILYPSANQIEMHEIEEATMDQVLKSFCNAMKSIANKWARNDEWMIKCNDDMFNLETTNLEHYALAMLEDMIKLTCERIFAEEEEMVDSPNSFSRLLSEPCSPVTPTSVLPEMCNITPIHSSLGHKRVGRLNPTDNQHLTFNMSPHIVVQDSKYMVHIANTSKTSKEEDFQVKNDHNDMLYSSKDVIANSEDGRDDSFKRNQIDGSIVQLIPTCITMDMIIQTPSLTKLRPNAQKEDLTFTISFDGVKPQTSMSTSNLKPTQSPPPPPPPLLPPIIRKHISIPQTLPPPPPPPPLPHPTHTSIIKQRHNVILSPPPPPLPPSPYPSQPCLGIIDNDVDPSPPSPSPLKSTYIASPPTPLPLPIRPKNMASSSPLTETTRNLPPHPPPPPSMISYNLVFVSLPPPPPPLPYPNVRDTIQQSHSIRTSNGTMSVPPPPMPMGKEVLGPPPPPSIGTKNPRTKKGSKLKRSSQMGNLYRFLKVKVEGSNLESKLGRKGKINSSSGGKQGMADALAEMTKRSTYFQQIEEDVKRHATEIKEMTTAITNFQTSDMSELIKFHKHVESHLEKLTDESQVLARFEDFPTKKLEVLRMAATLYSKLDAIACTLQKWPKESPVSQLLEKSESYINKIKGDLERIEQYKDEEEKKYASHKINFDFSILVRIKEFMVDVSSNCMELALKEWRDSNAREKKCDEVSNNRQKNGTPGKMLWKAFQFAYRIYTFCGGLDDRADMLTKELAHEIEKDPNP